MKTRDVVLFLCVISILLIGCVPAIAGERAAAGTAVPEETGATPGSPTVNAVKSVDKASALPGDTLNYTVVVSDAGTDATGVAFSDTLDANLTLVPGSLQTSPVAANDYYNCTGNLSISVPAGAGVLANDYMGLNPVGTITAYDVISANGAAVSVAVDGSFTYEPAAGYNGTDNFTYTLSNVTGTSVGTVYVTVSNMIWFINNAAGACTSLCDGRLSHPYTSLTAFITAGGGNFGDRIFIYSGAGGYAGNLSLRLGQRLIGQGDALNATTLGFAPALYSPTLPGAVTKPTLTGSLTVGTNNITVMAIDWHTAGDAVACVGASGVTFTDQCTVTADNGMALYVINSDGNFTFRSLSANGGQAGIIWNNAVQATGSLTVTGDGSTTGSGGTIHDMSGSDGQTLGFGCGVYLKNASNVSLSWMNLYNFQNYAVRGLSVNDFTMANCNITGTNGNNAAYYEGSVSFGANTGEPGGPANGIVGSATITNCIISGGYGDNFRVANQSGALNRLSITGTTIGPNSSSTGNDGILIEGESSALLNVTIKNCTLSGARGSLCAFILNGNNTADLIFQDNILSNPSPYNANAGSNGLTLISGNNVASGAFTTFNISGNTFRDANGHAVLVVKSTDPGTLSGTLNNNIIGVQATSDSGSAAGDGIKVQNAGLGTVTVNITNNRIYQYNNYGIELLTGGGAAATGGTLNAGVSWNIVSNPGTGGLPMNGFHLNGGTNVGDTFQICADISGNTMTGSGANGGTDFRLRQRQSTTIRLPGYAGANNDNTAVQNFVFGWQTGYLTIVASNTVGSGGGGYIGGAPCPLPSTFTEAVPAGNDIHHIVSEELAKSEAVELLPAALSRLASLGFDMNGIDGFDEERIVVEDLPAGMLAEVREGKIFLDRNASGRGWFIDPSPYTDEEYERSLSESGMKAVYGSPAENGVDLLSVIASCAASISYQEDDFKTFGPCVPEPGVRCLPAVNAPDESQEKKEEAAAQQDRTEPAILPSINVESGDTVSVSVGTLPAGKSVTLKFAGVIENPLVVPAAAVTNQAGISGSNFTALNSNTTTTALTVSDLAITKTDGSATAVPGGSTTYTITASNNGPGNVTGATVADTFPVVLTGSWTCVGAGGGTCTAAGSGNINDTVNLPSGGSVTYTVSATISSSATGTLSNTATITAPTGITDPNPANNSATDTDTLSLQADLSITKTDGAATAVPGTSLTYTIIVLNNGPCFATGATVTDTLPATVTSATWTAVYSGAGASGLASGTGSINTPVNLPSGGTATFTVTCNLSPSATGDLSNTAVVTAPAGTADPTPGNNSATDTDTLTPQADLGITLTDSPDPVIAGQNITYTITLTNSGPGDSQNVNISDNFPAGLTFVSQVQNSGPAFTLANTANSVTETILNFPAGGTAVFTVIANVSPSTAEGMFFVNALNMTAATPDPNMANNVASTSTQVVRQADLSVAKSASPDTVIAGQNITYTITLTNNGPSDSQGVNIGDDFPPGLTFVSQTQNSGPAFTLANTATSVTETISSFPAGATAVFTVVVNVPADTADHTYFSNAVNVSASTTDPNMGNNSAMAGTWVLSQADLWMVITDSPDPVTIGQNITYTVAVTNNGPGIASGIQVVDALPAGLAFVSASGTNWTCVNAAGTVTCTASGTLASGAAAPQITIVVTANTMAAIANTAVVSGTLTDPNPGNNISTATTTVNCQAMTVTNPAVASGTVGTPFSQTFTQTGGIGTTTFSTTSAIPAGLTLASNGTLSGTPTASGTFPIIVKATDANGCSGTGSAYTLVISCQAITVTPPTVSQGIQNVFFSQTFTQSGGIAPVNFSTTSTLPSGLSLSSNGTLSGTPTNYGSFPITVTATDTNGCAGSQLYTLVILQIPGAPVITAVTDNSPCGQSGISITFTAGSPATRHDLYRDGVLVVSGVSSPIGYNPGDTSSHSYVVRAINTDDACFSDSVPVGAADANGTPSMPVITGITDVNAFSFGLVINYTPGTPATRHDLYRDGVLVVTGFVSGGTYNPLNNQSHSYSILAVNGGCSTMSNGVTAVDRGSRLVPRPRVPLEPIPFPQ